MEPPLTEPLDNIAEIEKSLSHDWQPFESAPEGVQLLWYLPFAQAEYKYTVTNKFILNGAYWQPYKCLWQPLPPPPEIKNV